MRIGSGRFAGRALLGPPPERRRRGAAAHPVGGGTRPTAARLKKSLFAVVAEDLPGARVLDVCAGTGALGFEAVSGGAAECVFLERSRPMAARIGENAKRLGLGRVRVLPGDAVRSLRGLARRGERFDAAFFDPPWSEWEAEGAAGSALPDIAALVTRFVAAVHPASRSAPPEIRVPGTEASPEVRFRLVREVAVGDGAFSLFRPSAPPPTGQEPPLTPIP